MSLLQPVPEPTMRVCFPGEIILSLTTGGINGSERPDGILINLLYYSDEAAELARLATMRSESLDITFNHATGEPVEVMVEAGFYGIDAAWIRDQVAVLTPLFGAQLATELCGHAAELLEGWPKLGERWLRSSDLDDYHRTVFALWRHMAAMVGHPHNDADAIREYHRFWFDPAGEITAQQAVYRQRPAPPSEVADFDRLVQAGRVSIRRLGR